MDVVIIYMTTVDLCTVSVRYGPFGAGVTSERHRHRTNGPKAGVPNAPPVRGFAALADGCAGSDRGALRGTLLDAYSSRTPGNPLLHLVRAVTQRPQTDSDRARAEPSARPTPHGGHADATALGELPRRHKLICAASKVLAAFCHTASMHEPT
jgi:hypothetical protein